MQKRAEEQGVDYDVTPKGGMVLNTDNDESRRFVEHCFRTTSTMINPIIEWTDEDVWEFLNYYGCKSNPLYQCGSKRVGCVGCPMASGKGQKLEFIRYPKIRDNYIRAFNKMIKVRQELGLSAPTKFDWSTGVNVLRWWVGDDINQLTFETPEYLKDIPEDLL